MSSTDASLSGPVVKTARIQSIDTLRGVALFGILIMNIVGFGLPFGAYFNPATFGDLSGWNLTAYTTMDIFFEGSMRAIFSMLFGAGILLFCAKPDTAEVSVADLWFRRTLWLALFGIVDAYIFLWVGDILYVYGIAGLFLFVFRNSSPVKLMIYGLTLVVMLALMGLGAHQWARGLSDEVTAIEALGDVEHTEQQQATLAEWQEFVAAQFGTPEQVAGEVQLRQSGYLDIMAGFAPINFELQSAELYRHTLWDALAMMLIGMALMKWGVFDASRSVKEYAAMAAVGLGVGLSTNYYEVVSYIESGFAPYLNVNTLRPTYDIGRLFTAVGYIGVVMLVCKAGLLRWLQASLAAVGQMALTNYISHTLICNTLFMGFGFGLVGELQRYELYYVVFAIWVFQLVISPVWLKFFRFGPVEWLWRWLTYGKRPAFRQP